LAHLAVAILDESEGEPHPYAVAMYVTVSDDQTGFSLVDWCDSPWRTELYLGEMLDRADALKSRHKQLFFHIAEHVIDELPEVDRYFGRG
jgi:hypothetical protein